MARHKPLRETIGTFEPKHLHGMIFDAADWPMVLMTATLLERFLELAISLRFRPSLGDSDQGEMFSGYGPLASLSAKIMVAYAMGAITKEARDDLRIIKNIRNEAAHRISDFSLRDALIKQWCDSLSLASIDDLDLFGKEDAPGLAEKVKLMDPAEPRSKFIFSAIRVLGGISLAVADYLRSGLRIALKKDPSLLTKEMREDFKSVGIDLDALASSPQKSP
jgi:hypothetical protein